MRGSGRWSWTAACVLLTLGCAAGEGVAQDAGPPPAQDGQAKPAKDGGEGKSAGPRFQATVMDKFLKEPWQLRGAVLFVPEVSLFGGGGGEETRALVVKRGAAEVEVPLERIAKIEVGTQDEDLLPVKVLLRPSEDDAQPAPIEGTVRSSLELRGTFGTSDLKTVVKLREVKWVELAKES